MEGANKEVTVDISFVKLHILSSTKYPQVYLKPTPEQKAIIAKYAADNLRFHKTNSGVPINTWIGCFHSCQKQNH